jgi:hypothetical protein
MRTLVRVFSYGLVAVVLSANLFASSASAAPGRISTVSSGALQIGADYVETGQVLCPAGTKVTGGGMASPAYVYQKWSRALDDGSGWQVRVYGQYPENEFRVYAICVSGLTEYNIQTNAAWLAPGVRDGRIAFCSTGQLVGGGTWANSDHLTPKISKYFQNPTGGRDGWNAMYLNTDTVSRQVTTQAICANGIVNRTFQSRCPRTPDLKRSRTRT